MFPLKITDLIYLLKFFYQDISGWPAKPFKVWQFIVELFAKVRPNQIFGQSLARTYSSSIVYSWEHVLVDK